jgi:hypothetical protein
MYGYRWNRVIFLFVFFDIWIYICIFFSLYKYLSLRIRRCKFYWISAVRLNSFPRDSITSRSLRDTGAHLFALRFYQRYKPISGQPVWISPTLPRYPSIRAYSTINRFSKIRKYDFWVLSRETTFPFDGTSSTRVSFPANCRRQVKPNSLDALFDEHGRLHGRRTGAQKGKAHYENR